MLTPLSVIIASVHNNSTAPAVVDTSATSNPTTPSQADTTNCVVGQSPVLDPQDKGSPLVQGMKVKDRENEKAQLVEWASSLTLKDDVLTEDAVNVETLGVHKCSDLNVLSSKTSGKPTKLQLLKPTARNMTLARM